jgi:lipopolysaccharide export system protein LptA
MKGRLVALLLILGGLIILAPYAEVGALEASRKLSVDDKLIEISADRLEALEDKNVVIFSGSAVASQGERVIKAEKILLYYKKEKQEPAREGMQHIGKVGDLERIEAQGHVVITQGDRMVTGNKAVYYQETQKIIMTGDAVLKQGSSIVRGDKVQVFLNENRGLVEAGENKRVKATIFPTEKQPAP